MTDPLDLKVMRDAWEYFGGSPVWSHGNGHSGQGYYLYSEEYPDEGAYFFTRGEMEESASVFITGLIHIAGGEAR